MIKDLAAIYYEIATNNFEDIKEYCKNNFFFIFERNDEGNTLLHLAIEEGNLQFIQKIIQLGSCPLVRNEYGETPLVLAAGYESADVLEYLLKISEPCLLEADKLEIFSRAASDGAYENLEYLLKSGYDCNAVFDELPIIHYALLSEDVEIVRILHEYGADLEATNQTEMSLLYSAAAEGLVDIIEYLLMNKVSTEKALTDGTTPLIIASCYDRLDAVKVLISNNCNVNAKDDDGMTALLYAIWYANIDIVESLLYAGADINYKDKYNRGIEHYVKRIKRKKDREEMEKLLQLS